MTRAVPRAHRWASLTREQWRSPVYGTDAGTRPGDWRAGWRGGAARAMLAVVRVERHRYGLLLITLFLSLGVQGIAPHGRIQQLVVTAPLEAVRPSLARAS